ncbi:TPA: hypothetical protein H1016_01480 [archaeon]|uniref:Uncharacterized protein n=1 Tax=Candidatus Naiadarchaeum limnaeum TaxID=2756139 RepID=A0A832XGH1_9ARCH|nr:hypothetical protein [Candidatus Naiadarchaeum limnaeum]
MDREQHSEIHNWLEHWYGDNRKRMWARVGILAEEKVGGEVRYIVPEGGVSAETRNEFISGILKGLQAGINGAKKILEKAGDLKGAINALNQEKGEYVSQGSTAGQKEEDGFDLGVIEGLDLALKILNKLESPVLAYETLNDATLVNLTKVRNSMVRLASTRHKIEF